MHFLAGGNLDTGDNREHPVARPPGARLHSRGVACAVVVAHGDHVEARLDGGHGDLRRGHGVIGAGRKRRVDVQVGGEGLHRVDPRMPSA